MSSRIDRLVQIEKLLLDAAKAAYAGAGGAERAARDDARRALDTATRIEGEAGAAVGDEGPVGIDALRARALCTTRLEQALASARRRLATFAAAKSAAEAARGAMISRDRRKRGVETIAERRAAAIIKRIERYEEGVVDDLAGCQHHD